MTVQEFKKQLKRIGFREDSTSECKDMLVNLSFVYPINQVKSARFRCAVLFFPDHFKVHIATPHDEKFNWGTWNINLRNATSAGQVLAYAIGDILTKYHPKLIIE